jgi:serine/threonine protein kinase
VARLTLVFVQGNTMTPQPRPSSSDNPFATDEKPDTSDSIGFDPTPTSGGNGSIPRIEGGEPVPGYKLVKRLGSGGFGEVWQATGPGDFAVALKFIDLGRATSGFEMRSLTMMKEVRHAHLLTMFGSWKVSEFLIIAMELADQTLLDRFHACHAKGVPGIPEAELLGYMEEAAKGLDHLNLERRIQHRDIKPHNLLLVGGTVKVADFGLAKLMDTALGSHSGSGQSFPYAAPEFFKDQTAHTSDQYSLGITYCHLRGGKVPFLGSQAQIINGHLHQVPDLSMLPLEERPIVAKALAKNPNDRWPSCKDFVIALKSRAMPEAVSMPNRPPLPPVNTPFRGTQARGTPPGGTPQRGAPTPLPGPRAAGPRPTLPRGGQSSGNMPVPPPLRRRQARNNSNFGFIAFLIVFAAMVLGLLAVVVVIVLFKMLG